MMSVAHALLIAVVFVVVFWLAAICIVGALTWLFDRIEGNRRWRLRMANHWLGSAVQVVLVLVAYIVAPGVVAFYVTAAVIQ
jgi:polyferredoxin